MVGAEQVSFHPCSPIRDRDRDGCLEAVDLLIGDAIGQGYCYFPVCKFFYRWPQVFFAYYLLGERITAGLFVDQAQKPEAVLDHFRCHAGYELP